LEDQHHRESHRPSDEPCRIQEYIRTKKRRNCTSSRLKKTETEKKIFTITTNESTKISNEKGKGCTRSRRINSTESDFS